MTTATNYPSVRGRLRMLALAGTLAVGALVPAAPATFASGTDVAPVAATSDSGFEVSVDSVEQLTGLTAVVSGDGDGVNLRADAAQDADVLATVPDGTVVTLRIDMVDTVYDPDGVTRWWPVAVGGQEGWMTGAFLVAPGAGAPAEAEAPAEQVTTEAPAETAAAPSGVAYDYTGAMVATISADGDGVNLRGEPDAGSDVVATLRDGTVVDLRIDQLDTVYDAAGTRWWPVAADGAEGWVSGFYLVDSNQPAPPATEATVAPTVEATTAPARKGAFAVGDFGEVRTETRDGATLRAAGNPESDETGFVPEQGLVEILKGPVTFTNSENGWYQVRWDQLTGYIDGDLLIPAEAPASARTPTPAATKAAAATSGAFSVGGYVSVDSGGDTGVNVRQGATTGSDRVGFLDEDAVVRVTEGPKTDSEGDPWYRITDGDQSGWVAANLLRPASAPTQADAAKTPAAAEKTPAAVATNASSGFILPLDSYRFTQDYGCSQLGFYSYDPSLGCAIHDGVDLAAASGTPIHAVGAGTVVAAGWCDCGLGYYVEIDHGDGVHSVYGHMASQPSVATGQAVKQGDVIGPVGSTGLSTGPHTHFMIRLNGVTQDPKPYLPPLGG